MQGLRVGDWEPGVESGPENRVGSSGPEGLGAVLRTRVPEQGGLTWETKLEARRDPH